MVAVKTAGMPCLSAPHWCSGGSMVRGIRNSWYTVVYHQHIRVVVVRCELIKHGCYTRVGLVSLRTTALHQLVILR